MNKLMFPAVIGLVLAIGAIRADAASMLYDISGNSSVSAYTGSDGLTIQTALASNLGSVNFTLDDGDSQTFTFFRIWTTEGEVNNDDKTPRSISATLRFDLPAGSSSTVGGSTQAVAQVTGQWLFGREMDDYGQVVWNGPVTTTASDGRTFTVTLSNAIFNRFTDWNIVGAPPLNSGKSLGADITATITQTGSPAAVPLPAGVWGGLSLLAGLAAWRRVRAA